jgi:2-C-methyl-D-erythritol 4-phosphate cytidylyltransferase
VTVGAGTVAVVVAAGSGERLGDDRPKALATLAGRPLLSHALERLWASEVIDAIVVVYAPGHADAFGELCRTHDVEALVPGRATRTGSVRAGVAATGGNVGRIAVHDAARPLTPAGVIGRTVRAVTGDVVAAAPGLPVPDTLKRVEVGGGVIGTVDREGLWAVHTPQVIDAAVLRTTLAWATSHEATDDLGLVERAIAADVVQGRVVLVDGDVRDLKVTYRRDLALLAALLAAEADTPAPAEGAAT